MELTTENRLRLKRPNVESTLENIMEHNVQKSLDKSNISKEFDDKPISSNTSATEGDSLLNFKSPKLNIAKPKLREFNKSCNTKQKKKITANFKCINSNPKQIKFKQSSDKSKNMQDYQPSIESSFFKSKCNPDNKDLSADAKIAFMCPLCFKKFKNEDSQAIHMKICAFKNNITTKKLLNVIELQKRQEDERKSLGLLAAPVIQEQKKSISRKANMSEESDLELALALSKSLQEAEELLDINEIKRLSNTTDELESYSKGQLEKFGFANNKAATFVGSKKRRNNRVTILQTRSQDERNRILTERIAEILMGNEPVTQNQQEENKNNEEIKEEIVLKSHLLKDLCYKEDKLWDKTTLTLKQKCFYVANLSEHIIPKEETIVEEDYLNLDQSQRGVYNNEKLCFEISQTELSDTKEKCEDCIEKKFTGTLVNNWGSALNDSSASDIIIFVNENKYIWAHKLVFYVRCSNILLDIMCNDNTQFSTVKEKICWLNVPYDIALAFLEFIYCGVLRKHVHVLEDVIKQSSLRNLARKYKVKEMFAYLQRKEFAAKKRNAEIDNMAQIEYMEPVFTQEDDILDESEKTLENLISANKKNFKLNKSNEKVLENISNNSGSFDTELKMILSSISNISSPTFEKHSPQKSRENTNTKLLLKEKIVDKNLDRQSNVSPDMFDYTTPSFKEKSINVILDTVEIKENKDINNHDSNNDIIIDNNIDKVTGNNKDIFNSSKSANNTALRDDKDNLTSLLNTPKLRKQNRKSATNLDMLKVKSNLSLFIEKFQKANEESDLHTDTEISTLETPKLIRNPFKYSALEDITENKKNIWDKFDYNAIVSKIDINFSHKENNTMHLSFDTEKKLIESWERNIENCADDCENNLQANKDVNSTYTHLQNAVISSRSQHLQEENMNENVTNLQEIATTETSVLQCGKGDSILISDTDSDDNEVSIYARYKKCNKNNSIAKYRNFINEHVLKDSVKNNRENKSEDKCTIDYDGTILSDLDTNSDLTNTFSSDLERYEETSENELRNLGNGINNYESETDCLIRGKSPTDTHRDKSKSENNDNLCKLRNSKSTNDINLEALKYSQKTKLMRQNTNEFDLLGSLLLPSSPESDFKTLNTEVCNVNKANTFSFQIPEDFSRILENDIFLANVRINNSNDDNSNNSSLSVTEKTKASPTLTNNKNCSMAKNKSFTEELKSLDNSSNGKQNVMKFKRKCVSASNINLNADNVGDKESDIYNSLNQSQCECGRKKVLVTSISQIIVEDNITPPPNYSEMTTPELNVELNKYGLKIQKRSRAVKLLKYIYNELHPTITLTSNELNSGLVVVSSEDEEPPKKKLNCIKDGEEYDYSFSQNSIASTLSPSNIIDEEKQFDELETISATDNTSNIKDRFLKLLQTKKELYNKILAYEPLCIDSLHSMLKAEGVKCKLSALMAFLDEQCITFYCQDAKQKKDKRR